MATANSMEQLESMLRTKLRKAMDVSSRKMLAKTFEETGGFYTQGKPKIYKRTGALGNSPKTTALSVSGNTVSYDVYLDTDVGYLVPNPAFTDRGYPSSHTDLEVFQAAEVGADGILGRPGFWERSEAEFQGILDSTIGSYFN